VVFVLELTGQNDKNSAIFGHFRKESPSKRTKRGVKIVVRKKNCSEKIINTHKNEAKFDFSKEEKPNNPDIPILTAILTGKIPQNFLDEYQWYYTTVVLFFKI
jgi:hypothetical protein